MSKEQLAGRLVLGRLPGLVLDEENRRMLREGTLGGITLFKDNAADLEQLAALTHDIITSSFHPPVLTVDQEGGAVQRFEHILSPLPSPMALSALGDEESTREVTRISAGQLKALGFNLLLAPTLDLLTNPHNPIICTRAFADNVEQVSKMGQIVADEIEKQGLAACTKHFPGHGSTDQDSHLELAIVSKSKAALESFDMAPFKCVAAKAVLIGHIWLPELIKESLPASLSSLVVNDILRGEMGFDGLIVSDDMTMKAITRAYGLGEACVRAVEAGIDLLLVCDAEQSQEATKALAQAIQDGRLTMERIQASINRLDKLFSTRPRPIAPGADSTYDLTALSSKICADSSRSKMIAGRAMAVLKGNLSELNSDQDILVLAPAHPRYPLNLADELSRLRPSAKLSEIRYPLEQGKPFDMEKLEQAAYDKQVIFLTFRSYIYQSQTGLLKHLNQAASIVHIACDTPYDITLLENEAAQSPPILSLCTFDPSDQAMAALAEVLTGKIKPVGKLPILTQKTVSTERA